MAVSQNTQNGFYGNHASKTEYVRTLDEAEFMKSEMKASGEYSKVSHSRWNNGSRAAPRWEYKVMGWAK